MTKIEDLRFDDKNFNKHTEFGMSLLEKSLRENGAGRSILLDKDNNIIAGNGVIEAAGNIGLEKVKIVESDGSEIIAVKRTDVRLNSKKGREMALADNATAAADLDWDEENLKTEFEDEELKDWGVDLGWDTEEEVVEDEAPEVDESEPAKSKLGEVYILGGHKLMCGDSTDPDSVSKLVGGGIVDMWLTDPPYNVAVQGGNHGDPERTNGLKIQNDSMGDKEFREFLDNAFFAASNVMKPGAAFYIWHADSEGYNFRGACADNNLQVRECLVWNKNTMVMGRQDYQWKHEPCLYGWKDGTHNWYSDRKQTTVIDFDRPSRSEDHPTMKPIGLFAYLIQNSTEKGDSVLDTFGGSGTTLIACEQLGRKCYMMELDPKYCDVIRKRYWKFTTGSEEGWQDGTAKIA